MNEKPGYLVVIPWEITVIGGVNQVAQNLLNEIQKDSTFDGRLMINSWEFSQPTTTKEEELNVTRYRIREPINEHNTLQSLLAFSSKGLIEMFRLSRWLRRNRIKIINLHFLTQACFVFVLMKKLRLTRCKIILSIHGADIRGLLTKTGIQRAFWKLTLAGADAIVGCSDQLTSEVGLFDSKQLAKSSTIHNGIDGDLLKNKIAQSCSYKIPQNRKIILNIGTFEFKKGHDILLNSIPLVKKRDADAIFVCVGRHGPTFDSTVELAKTLGIADTVYFLPNLPHGETLYLLSKADLFVLPSRNEGFAIVLLEAGALGKPVVAADVCGVNELIENGKSGLMIPAEHPESLAESIIQLLEDPQLGVALGQALRSRIEQNFTWKATYRGYKNLACNLLNG